MQFFILFIGAMVFVFYIYEKPPVLFERTAMETLESPAMRPGFEPIERKYDEAFERRKAAADELIRKHQPGGRARWQKEYYSAQAELDTARKDSARLVEEAGGPKINDTNYIFLTFVTEHLPAGLVGLVLAVVFGATMTAISAEMSALATVSVIDVYKRHVRKTASDGHYLLASRAATVFWGCYAVLSAQFAKRLGSLIEAVNLLGSFFYGGMLGVFVLAFYFPQVRARGAFYGVLAGETVIFACWYFTSIAFLWYNVIGCAVVVLTGLVLSLLERPQPA